MHLILFNLVPKYLNKLTPLNKFIIYSILFVLINSITCSVVKNNQETGLYPADGDSIGIPILSTFFLTILGVTYLIILNLGLKYIYARNIEINIILKLASIFLLLILSLPYLGLLYFGYKYWFIPLHYIISFCFIFSLIILIMLFLLEILKLIFFYRRHSNNE